MGKKIDMTTWKVGGNAYVNTAYKPAKTTYQNEIVSPVTTNTTDNKTEYSAKIGSMYLSDYMYAAPKDKWVLVGWNSDASKDYSAATSVNWMHMGLQEWTISREATDASNALFVNNAGSVDNGYSSTGRAVRPLFNLKFSVTYVEGDGTQNSPIRIN